VGPPWPDGHGGDAAFTPVVDAGVTPCTASQLLQVGPITAGGPPAECPSSFTVAECLSHAHLQSDAPRRHDPCCEHQKGPAAGAVAMMWRARPPRGSMSSIDLPYIAFHRGCIQFCLVHKKLWIPRASAVVASEFADYYPQPINRGVY